MRLMIKVLLEIAAGVRVLEAATDDQALIVAGQFQLDLLISNLARPGTIDGLEFLRIFRVTHPQVPVVVVSDSLDPVTRMWAFRFGASACVNKLLATSKLVEAVRQVLAFQKAKVMPAKPSRHDVAWRQRVERCTRGRWRPHGRLDGC
jgi:DNA-binding NarL/FixJ family response regulator